MDIGKIILELRREKGYTQENLAQMLGVSAAAVSKWETDSAYPDIVLLPQLAEIFDVSLDYLFGYDRTERKSVPEVIAEAAQLSMAQRRDEAIALISKALTRYPNNSRLMLELGRHKFMLAQRAEDQDIRFREATDCFDFVVKNTDDDFLRQWAYHFLTVIATIQADFDRARAYNRKNMLACGIYPKGDRIFIEMLDRPDTKTLHLAKEKVCQSIFECASTMNRVVCHYLVHNQADEALSEAKRVIGVLENFGDTGLFYDDLSVNYEGAAWACAMKGEWEECLAYLEKACDCSEKHDTREGGFDCDLLGIEMPEFECDRSSGRSLLMALQSTERSDYDYIRDDERFKDIIRRLSE